MILAQLQEMAKDGDSAWNFRQPCNMRDVGCKRELTHINYTSTDATGSILNGGLYSSS